MKKQTLAVATNYYKLNKSCMVQYTNNNNLKLHCIIQPNRNQIEVSTMDKKQLGILIIIRRGKVQRIRFNNIDKSH
ncbi:hypothetical protein ACQPV1_08725 [Clostridium neonatale]